MRPAKSAACSALVEFADIASPMLANASEIGRPREGNLARAVMRLEIDCSRGYEVEPSERPKQFR